MGRSEDDFNADERYLCMKASQSASSVEFWLPSGGSVMLINDIRASEIIDHCETIIKCMKMVKSK